MISRCGFMMGTCYKRRRFRRCEEVQSLGISSCGLGDFMRELQCLRAVLNYCRTRIHGTASFMILRRGPALARCEDRGNDSAEADIKFGEKTTAIERTDSKCNPIPVDIDIMTDRACLDLKAITAGHRPCRYVSNFLISV
jgi:hypothetical protein